MIQIAAPSFDETEIEELRRCLQSGWVTQGPATEKFEKMIADRHEVSFVRATTSCTAALHLATMALGLGPGDEVIVPAFTWVTSAHCAEYVGAKAVFADIDLATYNLDPAALEAAITDRTRAIVAVHLFGLAAPMRKIREIAARRGLRIIEDAACAIGTTYNGTPVGALGDIGCFSFHPRKVVTTGEGGAVTTNGQELAEVVSSLRNHGATGLPKDSGEPQGPWSMTTFNRLGYNLRLSDIQAAVGIAQMKKLDALLEERHRRAMEYNRLLAHLNDIALPRGDAVEFAGHTYQSYVVRICDGGRARRNRIMAEMQAGGVQTRPGTHAVHRLGYYTEKYNTQPEDYPNACIAEDTTITLPIFPGMTDAQQEKVVELLTAGMKAV
jgi:dTDP-4-amino-4,6-dideoxygalactose transaminase